ncbi:MULTISPECIES: hypothetical protein [Methylosinus]|uniref:Uncharacterized protein n=1 Tax=Methylosinus trichosporium (strain ATCC 35070 / NCIMB 11131 / UNIQEM 75 / OB3b) TaxID=595536 RepID=A0A2D2CYD0_METT3|nr:MULTISPECIES: hypothetical protein [Methylosinus]ATQ67752.1 hypothetical protein CQW49_07490 [Methylosinus trichosporium OB3b]OBS51141.1 hypothetical protein A8B73_17615 [Methylosinus sp. 3S-1]
MADLFGGASAGAMFRFAPSKEGGKTDIAMTRDEIVARFGVADLKSPQAHKCFRCKALTGTAFGFLNRPGGRLVFACTAHFRELQ